MLVTSITCVSATTTGTCSTTTTASLAVGQHATFDVTYKVTSTDLGQGVINNSSTASGNSTTPKNPTKTTKVTSTPSTASVATAELVTSKSSSPISTTNVKPTQTVTYTLTFANTKGTVAAPADYTDNVSDVLDDAAVVTAPKEATGSGLTVSAITKGKFTITGTVPAGTTDTVTYSVKVDSESTDTGNHVLNNYLIPTGTTPPSTCKATNPDCTTNPVPAITIKKSATPTTATVGQTVTYKFVVTNAGDTALHNVTVTDKFTSLPTDTLSSPIDCVSLATPTGTCSGTSIDLAIGQSATFTATYIVTAADGAKGVIDNSATASGNSTTPKNPTKTTKITSTPSTAVVTAKLVVKVTVPATTPVPKPAPAVLPFTGAPLAQEVGGGIVLIVAGLGLLLLEVRRRRRTS